MNEATLKGALVKLVRQKYPSYVVERTEDKFTHGTPDLSITGNKINSRWEVKYANPHFKVKGIQELTMRRLAYAGYAFFLIYWESRSGERRTIIVDPEHINLPVEQHGNYIKGFDHHWVAGNIHEVHHDNVRS